MGTQRDWDAALLAFTRRYCAHSEWAPLCHLCSAWCDGFSGIKYHDTSIEKCEH